MHFSSGLAALLVSSTALALPVDPAIGNKFNIDNPPIPKDVLNEIRPIRGPGGFHSEIHQPIRCQLMTLLRKCPASAQEK
jgi:hypothetical protein